MFEFLRIIYEVLGVLSLFTALFVGLFAYFHRQPLSPTKNVSPNETFPKVRRLARGLSFDSLGLANSFSTIRENPIKINKQSILSQTGSGSSQGRRRDLKEPSFRFSGQKGEDPDAFINRLVAFVKFQDLSEEEVMVTLPMVLTKSAFKWYVHFGQAATNFLDFRQLFMEKYSNDNHDDRIKMKIYMTKQTSGEKISDYISKMSELNNDLLNPLEDDELIRVLRTNMDPTYEEIISPRLFTTIQLIESEACRIQDARERKKVFHGDKINVYNVPTSTVKQVSPLKIKQAVGPTLVNTDNDLQGSKIQFNPYLSTNQQQFNPHFFPQNMLQPPPWSFQVQNGYQSPAPVQPPLAEQQSESPEHRPNGASREQVSTGQPTWRMGYPRGQGAYRGNMASFSYPRGGTYRPNFNGQERNYENYTCFSCGQKGHLQWACPNVTQGN